MVDGMASAVAWILYLHLEIGLLGHTVGIDTDTHILPEVIVIPACPHGFIKLLSFL